jgi:2-polyprenyl-3-methyl-5-hydroxy-6-metoxy-1,4-benzoquinol methylase
MLPRWRQHRVACRRPPHSRTLRGVSDEAERLRRSWVANASAWTDAVRERRIESRRVTDAAAIEAVLSSQPRRVLDAGCGEGWLARELATHGVAVTGFDGSAALIEQARAAGGAEFVHCTYEDAIANPSVLGRRYDALVANFSLLDDRAAPLLAALRPLLGRRGRVIVQTVHPAFAPPPYEDGWRVETFDAFPGAWPESMPWYFRTLASWMRVFADAGYVVLEVREPMANGRPASIVFMARPAR